MTEKTLYVSINLSDVCEKRTRKKDYEFSEQIKLFEKTLFLTRLSLETTYLEVVDVYESVINFQVKTFYIFPFK